MSRYKVAIDSSLGPAGVLKTDELEEAERRVIDALRSGVECRIKVEAGEIAL
jgi:hypothetical protein